MKFECSLCNYSTNDGRNWCKHVETQKHLLREKNKEEQKHACIHCNIKFDSHVDTISHYEQELTKFKNEIKNLKKDNAKLTKENKKLTSKIITSLEEDKVRSADNTATLLESNKNLATTECNTMNFLTQNFTNAQALKCITQDKAHELLTHTKSTKDIGMEPEELKTLTQDEIDTKINNLCVEQMIFEHNNGNLHSYITDIVKSEYAKKDPQDQQIWNTDKSRLSYVIREAMNKKNEWIKDDKGVKIKEYVISPILKEIEQMIVKYAQYVASVVESDNNNKISRSLKMTLMERSMCASLIVKSIRGKILTNKIVSDMTKYFGISNVKKEMTKNKK
jgi:hypothetical protein